MRYEIYKDHTGDWRWRLRAQNGNVIAESGEGYRHRPDCENGIRLTQNSAQAPVVDMSAKIAESGASQSGSAGPASVCRTAL
jgi:uncharacterized protein YegP (UPF0339 family)